jgi:hypothetical protein
MKTCEGTILCLSKRCNSVYMYVSFVDNYRLLERQIVEWLVSLTT